MAFEPNRYNTLPRKMFDAYTERMDLKVQRLKKRLTSDLKDLETRVAALEEILSSIRASQNR